jgi:hypothetical protein
MLKLPTTSFVPLIHMRPHLGSNKVILCDEYHWAINHEKFEVNALGQLPPIFSLGRDEQLIGFTGNNSTNFFDFCQQHIPNSSIFRFGSVNQLGSDKQSLEFKVCGQSSIQGLNSAAIDIALDTLKTCSVIMFGIDGFGNRENEIPMGVYVKKVHDQKTALEAADTVLIQDKCLLFLHENFSVGYEAKTKGGAVVIVVTEDCLTREDLLQKFARGARELGPYRGVLITICEEIECETIKQRILRDDNENYESGHQVIATALNLQKLDNGASLSKGFVKRCDGTAFVNFENLCNKVSK